MLATEYYNNNMSKSDDSETNADMELKETELYRLICRATPRSIIDAWKLAGLMTDEEIRKRSQDDRSTYLHVVVNAATDVYSRQGSVSVLVPLIYRLALRGIGVNAQNEHGNTCLHLACLRPHAEHLAPHLIRIGADPCIQNKKKCRIIHTYTHHSCQLVKGQSSAKSGIWNAVEKEDIVMVERLLRSWCRVNIRKNKTLKRVGEETANVNIMRLLSKYEVTNEMVCAAFACDVNMVQSLLKTGRVDLTQKDESWEVHRPLLVSLAELGDQARPVIHLLTEAGATGASDYKESLHIHSCAFESSDFFHKVEVGTEESLNEALDILSRGEVDVTLISTQEERKGWTYLHYVVDRCNAMKTVNEERSRLLLRMIYRLALLGVNVHWRDAQGDTALVKASEKLDQSLMAHVIRIGGDPSMTDSHGRAVNEEVYEDKGKLVFDRKYRVADLPGIWVAVENNDVAKAERWLKSWARVNTMKGDRRLIEVARALKRTDIVKLLEEYEHINEFVCATFACDLGKMMDILALGKGRHKVNTIDDFFHVGLTMDHHTEYMARPVIISAMEICTPQVVDFLLNFGADLSKQHDESAPCGPAAFWAFRDHINNDNALIVAKHADVDLRDEEGATLLHRAIQKNRHEGKKEIVETLLERGANVAPRDHEGSTARDYIILYDVEDGAELMQIIDDHVLEMASNNQHYNLETLLLEGYDHVLDVRGTKRNKRALEIAELKEFKETIHHLKDFQKYKSEIDLLHEAAMSGDLMMISKLSGEKRCAWSRDKAGRTLLHNAVLFEHVDIVRFLVEQYPNLINATDNFNRTPLHLCVCLKDRHRIWPILQDGGADPNLVDANNMNVYEYVRELETPTAIKDKPRGRRTRDYRPSQIIEEERSKTYGVRAASYALHHELLPVLKAHPLEDIKQLATDFKGDLSYDDLDKPLLKICIEAKRQEVAKFLITNCGARAHMTLMDDKENEVTLEEYAQSKKLKELKAFIASCPKPETPEQDMQEIIEENQEKIDETKDRIKQDTEGKVEKATEEKTDPDLEKKIQEDMEEKSEHEIGQKIEQEQEIQENVLSAD